VVAVHHQVVVAGELSADGRQHGDAAGQLAQVEAVDADGQVLKEGFWGFWGYWEF
jgi:hypothetical protein